MLKFSDRVKTKIPYIIEREKKTKKKDFVALNKEKFLAEFLGNVLSSHSHNNKTKQENKIWLIFLHYNENLDENDKINKSTYQFFVNPDI